MMCVSETNCLKRKNNDEKLDFKELEELIGIVQEKGNLYIVDLQKSCAYFIID